MMRNETRKDTEISAPFCDSEATIRYMIRSKWDVNQPVYCPMLACGATFGSLLGDYFK